MADNFDYVGQSAYTAVGGGTFGTGTGSVIENWLTGNQDYARGLETMSFQNAYNSSEAAKARAFNAEQAQLQRDYEERMANTAYQRAVADLRAAGFNPALAVTHGGAPTPSGATASASQASSSAPHFIRTSSGVSNLVNSAFSLASRVIGAFASGL